jgi:hypothetical protein
MNILRFCLSSCLVGTMGVAMAATNSSPVTFNKEVLPILQKNCQECHRPGEAGPMSFMTYTSTRPWAKAIKASVIDRKMPPWFADEGYAHFAKDRRLKDADIATLVAWADSGATEGDAKDKPAPVTFNDGWNIKPDMIVEMPQDFHVPAKGAIKYQNIVVKANFPEDTWVVAAEVRPGNPSVVHHVRLDVREPGSGWMDDAIPGVAYPTDDEVARRNGAGENLLGKYNPGLGAQDFSMEGGAKFVPKGSDIVFSMHYTPNGKETTDRTKVGLVFAKTAPASRYITLNPSANNLVIPAGDPNAEVVEEVTVVADNARLVYVQPHMHLRGKDYELRLVYPTQEVQTVFKGKFNFEWQQGFELETPIPMPKGTRIIGISHFDNSANNPFNPDPTQEVVNGEQTWEEMSAVFLGVVIPKETNPQAVIKRSGPRLLKKVPGVAGPTLSAVLLPAPKAAGQ